MAAVSINIGPASHDDRLCDYPPQRWPAILIERRYYVETQLDYDCRCLKLFLEEAEEFYSELGYSSPDEMLEKELTIKPDWVRKAVACLSQRKVDQPSSAADLGLDTRDAKLLGHGGDRKSEEFQENQGSIRTLKSRGETQHYLLSRIARDRPELLNDIGPGKLYRSARAAAIAAGIVKDVPTVRLTDPAKVAESILQYKSKEWAIQLANQILEELSSVLN